MGKQPAAVIGVGQTHHRAKREDVSIAGLCREAIDRALVDANVSFDDIDAASFTIPPLTTIRGPVVEQAATVVRLLLDHLGGAPVSSRVLSTELIVRRSA